MIMKNIFPRNHSSERVCSQDSNSSSNGSSKSRSSFKANNLPPLLGNSNLGSGRADSNSRDNNHHQYHHHDPLLDLFSDESPPLSPLRLQQLSPSASSISSWSSGSQGSQMSDDGTGGELHSPLMGPSSSSCNSNGSNAGGSSGSSKETYNTKFARYHLETYRQNDRMRWNFDFDHNRPLEDSHHHHHQTVSRYQWEPAI